MVRHEAVVKLLLDKEGVDPDSQDKYGWRPLSFATAYKHEAIAKLLQSHSTLSLLPPFLLNLLPPTSCCWPFLGCGKWKAVESGRSNDAMHMVESADLSILL